MSTVGFGPPVLTDGGAPPLRLYPEQVQAMRRAAQPPPISAAAGYMLDLDASQVLYARDERRALPPASTAKIMTALLTLQHAVLSDVVTVSAQAASTGGSTMGLRAGEQLTVSDLMYGLLLPSGNDAAVALAEHVSGNQNAFVALMNAIAAEMQLGQTHFVNPHGMDDPGQLSSAADLVTLARAALEYPAFAAIVATPSIQVAGHSLVNTNQLLGTYSGADGIKTGTTDSAGECLVASVSRHGHRLLLALLDSTDRYADAKALLDYAAAGWVWTPVVLPDDALAWQSGPDGRTYRLRQMGNADVFLSTWEQPLVHPVRVLDKGVPITGTQPVGTLRLMLQDQILGSVPLAVWNEP
jgi:serine-type D-Ala-D-Ala carboxypeptidase (penicillin-binding protein 5/6)